MEDSYEKYISIYANRTCDYNYVPTAIEHIESLRSFGIGLLCFGGVLSTLTLYFAVDACHNISLQKNTCTFKTNAILILVVYPIASVCSLTAIAMPRAQLLSEALTQIFLTIGFYRLYLLLVDVGRRRLTNTPPLMLKVGPCCCWPCLRFPALEMTDANLSWLKMLVLQLPIIQGTIYCIILFMALEEPIFAKQYGVFLQPFSVISILLGLYGLTIMTKSLQAAAPETKPHHKALVTQLVFLFSKLQAGIVKSLADTGLFPCNPPLTPEIYANVTYNTLMLAEMLLLCYAARYIYFVDLETEKEPSSSATDRPKDKTDSVDLTNNNEPNSARSSDASIGATV